MGGVLYEGTGISSLSSCSGARLAGLPWIQQFALSVLCNWMSLRHKRILIRFVFVCVCVMWHVCIVCVCVCVMC